MFISKLVTNSAQQSHGCETEEETEVSVSCLSAGRFSRDWCDSGLLKHQFGSKQVQAEAVMLICGDMRLMCDVV